MLIGISGYIGSGKDTVAQMVQFLTLAKPEDRNIGYYNSGMWQHNSHPYEIKKFAGKLKLICSILTGILVADFEKQSVKDSELGEEWNYWPVQGWYQGNKVGHLMGRFSNHEAAAEAEKMWRMAYQWEDSLTSIITESKTTVREFLQRMGTDAMRDVIHPNIHVNALFADYTGICQQTHTTECRQMSGGNICYNAQEEHQCKRYPNWVISDCRFPNEAQAIKDRGGIVIRINRPEHWVSLASGKPVNELPPIRHSSETSLDNWTFDAIIENNGTMEDLLDKVQVTLKQFNII